MNADIVVIGAGMVGAGMVGAGMVGAAIAYGLADQCVDVLVLDGNDRAFRSASANFREYVRNGSVYLPANAMQRRIWADFQPLMPVLSTYAKSNRKTPP